MKSKKKDRISKLIISFYNSLREDKNHRYRSWEHCYYHFRKLIRKNITNSEIDLASLNLAFFLASWGMYRAKSFLIWKDYKIHKGAVKILLQKKYYSLWNLEFVDEKPDTTEIELITALKGELKRYYQFQSQNVNGEERTVKTLDTLISKILLGTMCCVPAFDRYFIKGLKKRKQSPASFSTQGIKNIFKYYYNSGRNKSFSLAQEKIKKISGLKYPPMRLVDMYFWKIGTNQ